MTFYIFKQLPRPALIVQGQFCLGKDGMALAMDGDGKKIHATLDRARVDWMAATGFMVSGFEFEGVDRQCREKYRYQEWFCGYVEGLPVVEKARRVRQFFDAQAPNELLAAHIELAEILDEYDAAVNRETK